MRVYKRELEHLNEGYTKRGVATNREICGRSKQRTGTVEKEQEGTVDSFWRCDKERFLHQTGIKDSTWGHSKRE